MKRHLLFVSCSWLVVAAPLLAGDSPKMRGSEAAAIAVAVNDFKKIYAKPDLHHYSVLYARRGQDLEITFDPDLDRHLTIGGGTDYGPAMTYVVSLKTFKILRYNFYR